MRIVLFYQYYHNPDCGATSRHYTLLKHLAKHHEITVVTTDAWKVRRLTHDFPWLPDGVREVVYHVPYSNKMSARRRLVSFVHYAVRALIGAAELWDVDLVWGTSTPLSAAWAAERCARRTGIPWVFEVRDLWPDFPIQMGAIRNPLMIRQLQQLERRLYASADHIVALSPDMGSHIARLGVEPDRLSVMPNGTDFELIDTITEADVQQLREAHNLQDRRVVLYAGTFGRANDIPTLITAAERLADRQDLCLVFMGYGFYEGELKALAARQENVRLLDMRPRMETLRWFRLADLSLVPFIGLPVLSANSPAKLFDSLGCGTPVVVTNPGWMEHLVTTTKTGWYVPAEEPVQLARQIALLLDEPDRLEQAGAAGEALAREQFDRVEQAETYHRLFSRLGRRDRWDAR